MECHVTCSFHPLQRDKDSEEVETQKCYRVGGDVWRPRETEAISFEQNGDTEWSTCSTQPSLPPSISLYLCACYCLCLLHLSPVLVWNFASSYWKSLPLGALWVGVMINNCLVACSCDWEWVSFLINMTILGSPCWCVVHTLSYPLEKMAHLVQLARIIKSSVVLCSMWQ